jgi:hypothetical protein
MPIMVDHATRTNNGFIKEALQCPECWVCIGIDVNGKFWRRDIFEGEDWTQWDPDLLSLALEGRAIELSMVQRLLPIRA